MGCCGSQTGYTIFEPLDTNLFAESGSQSFDDVKFNR